MQNSITNLSKPKKSCFCHPIHSHGGMRIVTTNRGNQNHRRTLRHMRSCILPSETKRVSIQQCEKCQCMELDQYLLDLWSDLMKEYQEIKLRKIQGKSAGQRYNKHLDLLWHSAISNTKLQDDKKRYLQKKDRGFDINFPKLVKDRFLGLQNGFNRWICSSIGYNHIYFSIFLKEKPISFLSIKTITLPKF